MTGQNSVKNHPLAEVSAPRSHERAQLLSETLGQLLSARDPDSMVRQLLPKVAAHIRADVFFNFMVNEKGDALYLHSCAGMPEAVARAIQTLHYGALLSGVGDTSPVIVENLQASDDPRTGPARESGLQNYVCHPLAVGGRVLGALGFGDRSRPHFEPEELEFLRVISQYAAVALDRLCASRDLRKLAFEREQAEAQVRFQRDTLERIIQGAPLTDILERLTGDVEALLDRELAASILLVDDEGRYQHPISARPLPSDWPQIGPPPPIEHFQTDVFKTQSRVCWCTPIMSSTGRILGAFALRYREPTEPAAQETRMVDMVTRLAAIAIERKQSEQALMDSQAKLSEHAQNLELRVAERTVSLREAVAQMEEFSYSISHDLRSPLRAMQGYAAALMEDYGAQLDEQGRHFLRRIVNSSSRMDRLIQDILTYSRLSRREFFPQPILLERLVNDIIQQYPEMQAPNAAIHCEPLLNVMGHEPSLSQAISNLLSNAVKFVPPEITPRVRLWTEGGGGLVRLWVQDNGIGVRPSDQPRLFGMFERLHVDKKYPGTGIGLAIVRRAMDRMGGKAGMESDGSNGSKFWLELPEAEIPLT